jgi:hypothetical protein
VQVVLVRQQAQLAPGLVGERNVGLLGEVVVAIVGAVAEHGTDEEVEHDRRELAHYAPEVEPSLPAQVACVSV